jgi:stearoyl-CoA desaturase (Delta-9 desaturase)
MNVSHSANPDPVPERTSLRRQDRRNPQKVIVRPLPKSLQTYQFGAVAAFVALQLAALGVFFAPFRWSYFWLMLGMYAVRMFGVTAGYHRYFSHRSFKLNRFYQLLMAILAQSSGQKSVLWWAAHHRVHHRHSDQQPDVHSPGLRGFWWAHVGWVISNTYDEYDPALIRDFSKFPELRWLDRYHWVPTAALGAAIYFAGGLGAFLWGYVLSTVILYHATFCINSLAHVWGTRRFATADESRNNFVLALVTFGEGWHNNHHRFMYACRQGILWWELDLTYYGLRLLNYLGVARELRGVHLPSSESEARP